jgi:hypothetical protein
VLIYRAPYIPHLYPLDVGPWARLGQREAFVNLADQEQDDASITRNAASAVGAGWTR